MEKLRDTLDARQVRVLVVSFTPPKRMRAFLAGHPLPFPSVSDPDRTAYREFSLGRVGWTSFLKPSVIWGYLRRVFQGYAPAKPVDEDMLQLGGDFLLDASGRLTFARPSEAPTDRPTAADLREAITKLR